MLILNSANYLTETNSFVSVFPVQQRFVSKKLGLVSCNLYNSFNNVSTALNNNKVILSFPNGSSAYTDYILTLPNGFYDQDGFTEYLNQQLTLLGLYTVTNDVKTYYIKFSKSVSLKTVMILTAINVNAVLGNGVVNTTKRTPYIKSMTSSFAAILGFSQTTYGANQTSSVTYVGDLVPNPYAVSSLILLCNLTSNNRGFQTGSSSIIASIPIGGATSYGSLISQTYSKVTYIDIPTGAYDRIEITICDQQLNKLSIYDTNALILLNIV
jgi:hypothetical protein